MQMTNRKSAIELLRIFAMLLILSCHFIIHMNWHLVDGAGLKAAAARVGIQTGQVGVVIFFIITGWFMSSKPFSAMRVLNIWMQVFLYSASLVLFGYIIWGIRHPQVLRPLYEGTSNLFHTLQQTLLPIIFGEYWFMTSYVILLLLVPFINAAIDNCPDQWFRALIFGLLGASALPLLGTQIGIFTGVVYAITCYLIGAYLRKYATLLSHITTPQVFSVIAVYMLLSLVFNYFAKNTNPVTQFLAWPQQLHDGVRPLQIMAGAAIFAWVQRLSEAHDWQNHAINRVAPSTFGVYLIHESYVGWRLV